MKKLVMSIVVILAFGVSSQDSDNTLLPRNLETIRDLIEYVEESEVKCLAQNIYFESRSDNLAGKIAVTDVVINRINSTNYPDTACGVVYQGRQDYNGNMIRNKCQFSWYCDGKSDKIPNLDTNDNWQLALDLAADMYYNNNWVGITEGATHYHATYVKPAWAYKLNLVGRIGQHIFYRQ